MRKYRGIALTLSFTTSISAGTACQGPAASTHRDATTVDRPHVVIDPPYVQQGRKDAALSVRVDFDGQAWAAIAAAQSPPRTVAQPAAPVGFRVQASGTPGPRPTFKVPSPRPQMLNVVAHEVPATSEAGKVVSNTAGQALSCTFRSIVPDNNAPAWRFPDTPMFNTGGFQAQGFADGRYLLPGAYPGALLLKRGQVPTLNAPASDFTSLGLGPTTVSLEAGEQVMLVFNGFRPNAGPPFAANFGTAHVTSLCLGQAPQATPTPRPTLTPNPTIRKLPPKPTPSVTPTAPPRTPPPPTPRPSGILTPKPAPTGSPGARPIIRTPSPEELEKMRKAREAAQQKPPIKTPPPPIVRPTPTPPPRPPAPSPSAGQALLATVYVYELLPDGSAKLLKTITKPVPPGTTDVTFNTTGLRSGVLYKIVTSLSLSGNPISKTEKIVKLEPGTNKLVVAPKFIPGPDDKGARYVGRATSPDNPYSASFGLQPGFIYILSASSAIPGCGPKYPIAYGFAPKATFSPALTGTATGSVRVTAPNTPQSLFVSVTRAGTGANNVPCAASPATILTLKKVIGIDVVPR
jgi:hypothetical protein